MKIVFDISKNQVSIEGDPGDLASVLKVVQDLAPKLSRIEFITGHTNTPAESTPIKSNGTAQPNEKTAPGMREFARSITPGNNYEKIAAIAAYKAKYEGRDGFSPKEMGEWFVMCGFEKPVQMSVAMFDAKRKYGYLDKGGHGEWKLSTGGQNFVTRKLEGTGGA